MVAAGGQEHEDRIFIRACTRGQTKKTKVNVTGFYLFLSDFIPLLYETVINLSRLSVLKVFEMVLKL